MFLCVCMFFGFSSFFMLSKITYVLWAIVSKLPLGMSVSIILCTLWKLLLCSSASPSHPWIGRSGYRKWIDGSCKLLFCNSILLNRFFTFYICNTFYYHVDFRFHHLLNWFQDDIIIMHCLQIESMTTILKFCISHPSFTRGISMIHQEVPFLSIEALCMGHITDRVVAPSIMWVIVSRLC